MKIKFLVKQNSQPVFITRLKNQFKVKINDNFAYNLPEIVDPQGNSKPEILIEALKDFEVLYPPFMHIFN